MSANKITPEYTPEQLREVANDLVAACLKEFGYVPTSENTQISRMFALASAQEENAALREQLAERDAELARLKSENDTLRGLLGNSAKPCAYCGLAAEDQAKCPHGFPGCSRADDQMLSAHFADGYRAERAEAELAERDAEIARLRQVIELNNATMRDAL